MLLRINTPDKFPLFDLWRMVMIFTFNKKNCPMEARGIIEQELIKWNRDYQIDMVRYHTEYGVYPDEGSVLHETYLIIKEISQWVVDEEAGMFTEKAENYIKHGIDFRLAQPACHFFPECRKLRNFARGKAALEQNKLDYPEIYDTKNTKEMEIIE